MFVAAAWVPVFEVIVPGIMVASLELFDLLLLEAFLLEEEPGILSYIAVTALLSVVLIALGLLAYIFLTLLLTFPLATEIID